MFKSLVSIMLLVVFVNFSMADNHVVKITTVSAAIENPWKILSSANIHEYLKVTYRNTIGFISEDTCMAIFESPSEYKLTASWIQGPGKIVQKHNITDLSIEKVEIGQLWK